MFKNSKNILLGNCIIEQEKGMDEWVWTVNYSVSYVCLYIVIYTINMR